MQLAFWQLEHLSDAELVDGLQRRLSQGRRLTAETLAHLAEVEQRRLHLHAACSSLFDYCVSRLGLSEDEACRRIDVARLARRYPSLFPLLAEGRLSLSVAALLKSHLTHDNHTELLAAVSGKSVTRAREHLAARFPQPDIASGVRKLPERRSVTAPAQATTTAALPTPRLSFDTIAIAPTVQPSAAVHPSTAPPSTAPPPPPASVTAAKPPERALIEPLSSERYRVQFTATAALKAKLDQCRDFMRHSNPNGDLAPIVERALDLLLAKLMREHFGAAKRPRAESTSAPNRSCITRATQRATVERDGLRCSWTNPEGHRCESRAWLEYDHRQPRGKGGSSQPSNIRMLCRSHNRRAAELEYGRDVVDRAIKRRQKSG